MVTGNGERQMLNGARIDLNADLGESFGTWRLGEDAAMLEVVSSANVACGFHAGDPLTLQTTCRAAALRGVAIGAQVGYRDLAGFGRRFIDIAPDELTADVLYQLGALEAMARAAGSRVSYVKPHGALYNTVVHHRAQAGAVIAAMVAFDADLPVLALPGSVIHELAAQVGIRTVGEAFADRAYRSDGTLVPRTEPGAVLTDPAAVADRVLTLATSGTITAADGSLVAVAAESICLHGDTPGAADLARAVREALVGAGVTIAAFSR